MSNKRIINIDGCLGGGTILIEYQNGDKLYIDGRISTETRYHIYDKYPSDSNAKQVILSIEEYGQLIQLILNYNWKIRT